MQIKTDNFDDLDPAALADPSSFSIDDIAQRGGVFVIPVDAPIPSELSDAIMPKGGLYDRLAALASIDYDGFRFVPVSGAELLHIERAWRLLQVAKRVYALFDLPGARYDVMFTQAVRQIGIRKLEWPSVSESIAAKVIANQRTKDAAPWNLGADLTIPARRLPATASIGVPPLEAPPDED